jgi:DNA-binding response OmpR family regulator
MDAVLLATDADWVFDEVDAALADDSTSVNRVRSGRMVLPAVQQLRPELVLLDLQIGNIGGVAASLALRQEQDMGRIDPVRIIMLLDRDADVYMAQLARADGWLVKPLDSIRLRRAATAVRAGDAYFEGMLEATT